mmetsp:Transcript_13283/g.25466  ORF Transcript_13283/g.25466 Transcript_13283/m.25466 type:complete len:947 (+) Transcript_13283:144-2984(+)
MGFFKKIGSRKEKPESPSPDRPGSARGGAQGGGGDYGALVHGAVHAGNFQGEEDELVEMVCGPARPSQLVVEEVARALLSAVEDPSSQISLRALLVLDRAMATADASFLRVVTRPHWMLALNQIVTTSLDPQRRSATMQLISDWSAATHPPNCEFAKPFKDMVEALRGKGLPIPEPDSARRPGAMPGSGEEERAEFEQLSLGASPPSSSLMPAAAPRDQFSVEEQMTAIEQQTANYTANQIHAMLSDIKLLDAAIQAGGKSACAEGDEIWDAAERCKQWQNTVQDMLMQNVDEELLAAVLEGNDTLNMVLYKWQMSGAHAQDPGDLLTSASGEGAPLVELDPSPPPQAQAFVPTAAPSQDPFASWNPSQSSNPFALLGTGMGVSPAASAGAHSDAEVSAMKSEMAQLRQALSVSEKKVDEAAERMRALLQANSKLEDDLATANENAQAQMMKAASATEQAELAAEAANATASAEESEKAAAAKAAAQRAQQEAHELATQKADVERKLRHAVTEKQELEVKLMEAESHVAATERKMEQMQAQIAQASAFHDKMEALEKKAHLQGLELKKESVLRKKAMNELRALKGNIRVCARVRPAKLAGTSGGGADVEVALNIADEFTIELETQGRGSASDTTLRKFEYDAVFSGDTTQEQVYEEAKELLQMSMDGFNVCFFAYGQTGSGKTHTILGSPDNEGILPRVVKDVFDFSRFGGLKNEVKVHAYMLELYQDNLLDMFDPKQKKKLDIKRDPSSGIVSVDGACVLAAENSEQLRTLLDKGLQSRKMASTKMNDQSSRSHLIFSILVQNYVPATNTTTTGKMTFVDLAGSERVARSGAVNDDQRLAEAKAINKSLSALGDVVAALTTNTSFIPYRNHKLTQLMADSLGGNAKCCMIVNVSPLKVDADETRNSLDYASRVKNVTNEASKSMETKEITKLKAIIEKLKAQKGP